MFRWTDKMKEEIKRCGVANLTPHDVRLFDRESSGIIEVFPATGYVLRLKEKEELDQDILNFPLVRKEFVVADEDLPPEEPGVRWIVPAIVQQLVQRRDFYVPDTGPVSVVRDVNGVILGVTRFWR